MLFLQFLSTLCLAAAVILGMNFRRMYLWIRQGLENSQSHYTLALCGVLYQTCFYIMFWTFQAHLPIFLVGTLVYGSILTQCVIWSAAHWGTRKLKFSRAAIDLLCENVEGIPGRSRSAIVKSFAKKYPCWINFGETVNGEFKPFGYFASNVRF